MNFDGESMTPELCSTPRTTSNDLPDATVVSQIEGMHLRKGSPADSEESEADILERSIRLSCSTNQVSEENTSECKLQQLTHEIEPTTVFSGSIMHTAESPSQLTIDPSYYHTDTSQGNPNEGKLATYFPLPSGESQFANQTSFGGDSSTNTEATMLSDLRCVEPSAPTLQQIQSQHSVPLMDVSRFQPPTSPGLSPQSKQSHLGQRPFASGSYIYQVPTPDQISETNDTNTPSSPQEIMNISLSPITSPNTSFLLKPSVHWYYSNPGGSWNPFSYLDSEKLEKAFSARNAGR